MGFGRAEARYDYGGDLAIAPNGDFIVLIDTPQSAPATLQRIIQLINTCALDTDSYDSQGNPVTLLPDDLFHPQYGSSIPRLIGLNATNDVLNQVKARLLAAFSTDPGIAQTPAPSVTVSYVGGNVVVDNISVYDVAGNPILIPSQPIPVFGMQA
jgi:hypothetical protein